MKKCTLEEEPVANVQKAVYYILELKKKEYLEKQQILKARETLDIRRSYEKTKHKVILRM